MLKKIPAVPKLTQNEIFMPKNIETVEVYVHDGKLPDDKYRLPWKRGKGESYQVLIEESVTVYDDEDKFMPTKPVYTIEPFDSKNECLNESVTDEVNFEIELDIVQSSNPSSQDIFTPDDFFDTFDEFDEIFEKERIKWGTDEYRIDVVGPVDTTLYDALKLKPSLSELKNKLNTVNVKDPLLLNDGQIASENVMFNLKLQETTCDTPMLHQTFDSTVFYEKFMKIAEENADIKVSMEEVVTEELGLMIENPLMEIDSILKTVTGPITHVQIEEEFDIKEVICKDVVKQSYEDLMKLEVLTLDLSIIQHSTFLDFNEIIVTEQDRFCEKAVLDVPEIESSSWMDPYYIKHLLPKIEEANIEKSELRFLDEDAKQSLMQAQWQNEKFGNEILACRLPETKIQTPSLTRVDPLEAARQILGDLKHLSTGMSDLALSWEIVKSCHEVIDPSKKLEQCFTNVAICDSQQDEVETFEKFSTVEAVGKELCTISAIENNVDKQPSKANTNTSRSENKTKPIFTSCDPLEAFMALRSKVNSNKEDNMKSIILQDSNISDESDNSKPLEEKATPLPENDEVIDKKQDTSYRSPSSKSTKAKTKHHTVQIKLSDELHEILDVLQASSEDCMIKLKQCGELPSNATFLSLSTDVSRFMLKQREKYLQDNQRDGLNDPTFRLILILHGLVGAAGLAVNCCLESAIGYINALQDKYKDILGSAMDPFREKLFQMRTYFHQKNLLHPKIISLCREVEIWLRQKRAKSKDCEQKILVLIKHDIPSLMNCLTHALSLGNILYPVVLTSNEPESIIKCLDQHNCVIAPCRLITDSFPWAQFNLVMEYEYEENSDWQRICLRQHIRHIGLFMNREISEGTKLVNEETRTQYSDKQIIVIGSTKITENTELLHLLEAGQNIVLVERDYSCLKGWNHLYYSDIDVDANTGIVIQNLEAIEDDSTIQYLVIKMAALTLKYTNCWLILSSSTQSKRYAFESHVISNIAKLQSDIANVVHHTLYASVKVLTCRSNKEIASLVRNICETTMTDDVNKPISQWLQRTWILGEFTQTEMFLLTFPCLNSFSAQLLMDRLSMASILMKSAAEISTLVPEININLLKALEAHVKKTTNLHLRGASLIGSNNKSGIENLSTKQNTKFPMLSNGRVEQNDHMPVNEYSSHYFKTSDTSPAFFSNKNDNVSMGTRMQNSALMKPSRENFGDQYLNQKLDIEKPTEYYSKVEANYPSAVIERQKLTKPQPRLFQNEIVPQLTETFEYNHGLPYTDFEKEKRKPSAIFEHADTFVNRTQGTDEGYINYPAQIKDNLSEFSSGSINSLSDFEKEFPSAENLYKSLYSDTQRPSSIYCPELEISGIHDTLKGFTDGSSPYHLLSEQSNSIGDFEKPMYLQQTEIDWPIRNIKDVSVTIPELQIPCSDKQNENNERNLNHNFSLEKFDFQPKIIEPVVVVPELTNKNQSRDTEPNFIVNPEVKRLSRKQTVDLPVEKRVDGTLFSEHTSFANELRETTKKALENSQQFSRFESNARRYPRQNIRVGLAQPLVRAIKDEKPVSDLLSNICDEERQLMKKSLWSVENSPPMDLDYENPGMNNLLYTQQPQYGRSNKAVFTSQTPIKKRKLTYQPVAGRKGQTKLVFK